jgi:hypothetical protein
MTVASMSLPDLATTIGPLLIVAAMIVSVLWTMRAQIVFLTSFSQQVKHETTRIEADAKERHDRLLTVVEEQARISQNMLLSDARSEKDLSIVQRDLDRLTHRMDAFEQRHNGDR